MTICNKLFNKTEELENKIENLQKKVNYILDTLKDNQINKNKQIKLTLVQKKDFDVDDDFIIISNNYIIFHFRNYGCKKVNIKKILCAEDFTLEKDIMKTERYYIEIDNYGYQYLLELQEKLDKKRRNTAALQGYFKPMFTLLYLEEK